MPTLLEASSPLWNRGNGAPKVVSVAVVVDIVPRDVPAEQARVLVDACTSAVRRGICQSAEAVPESSRPSAVALVVWQSPAFLEAMVRVGRGNGEWASRRLVFAARDPSRERWVAVGLTIAELLDAADWNATPEGATAPDASTTPKGVTAPDASTTADASTRTNAVTAQSTKGSTTSAAVTTAAEPNAPPWVPSNRRDSTISPPARAVASAGVLIGSGWDRGGPMLGGWAAATLNTFNERFLALAGASYATSRGPALPLVGRQTSRWIGLELGWGVQSRLASFRLWAMPELALQMVRVDFGSARELSSGETQVKLRGGAAWKFSRHWELSLGGALRVLPVDSPSNDPNRIRRSGVGGELQAGVDFLL